VQNLLNGIIASQISGRLWTAGSSAVEAIATVTLSSAASSITFTGIPQNYSALEIRSLLRTTGGGPTYSYTQFNGDTNSNYWYHYFEGNGNNNTTGGHTNNAATSNPYSVVATGSEAPTNYYAPNISLIVDYASSLKYKTFTNQAAIDESTSGSSYVELNSFSWQSNSPVTSLTIVTTGTNFAINSTVALYGVR
jgi:hypothetical protein